MISPCRVGIRIDSSLSSFSLSIDVDTIMETSISDFCFCLEHEKTMIYSLYFFILRICKSTKVTLQAFKITNRRRKKKIQTILLPDGFDRLNCR